MASVGKTARVSSCEQAKYTAIRAVRVVVAAIARGENELRTRIQPQPAVGWPKQTQVKANQRIRQTVRIVADGERWCAEMYELTVVLFPLITKGIGRYK